MTNRKLINSPDIDPAEHIRVLNEADMNITSSINNISSVKELPNHTLPVVSEDLPLPIGGFYP